MNFNHLNVNLLEISAEASKHKKAEPSVINATVGVFLNDDNNLYAFNSVNKTVDSLSKDKVYRYLAIDGGYKYVNSVKKYLFKDSKELTDVFKIVINWTAGGSGAIYMALSDYNGKTILLPNIRWPEYDTTCKVLKKEIVDYNFIKDNKFDLKSIAEILSNKTDELLLVINDPAHNPTGYNMSKSDYLELIKLLNSYNNLHISLLIDLAYLDFSSVDYRKEIMPLFKGLNSHVSLCLAFSGSKSFGVYGLRMGALVYLNKDLNKTLKFKETIYEKTKAIHGSPNSYSVLLLNELINNAEIYLEQQEAVKFLNKRAEVLLKELDDSGLKYYPYSSGFFLTIKVKNPFKVTETLKSKNVYVVPTYEGLRIALSAITEKEIKRLVKIIKESIN